MNWRRLIRVLILGAIVAYLVSFAFTFELIGDPVRSEGGEWLGPAKRFHPEVTDIGKVYVYHGNTTFAYALYRPLCLVWLWLMGFR